MKTVLGLIFMIWAIALAPAPACAESKEIIAEGSYVMNDSESPTVAEERALLDAKRAAVEQARIYLESITEVKNLELSQDDIRTMAAGELKTTVLESKRTVEGSDSIRFWVKVRCLVDADTLKALKERLANRRDLERLKKMQAEYDAAMQEVARLKQQLAAAPTADARQDIKAQITRNEQTFSAVHWFDKACALEEKKNIAGAIQAYSKAIELNPRYADAYNNRGVIYNDQNQNELALADYNQAIALSPQDATYYYNRGDLFHNMGREEEALSDFNRSIALDPRDPDAYDQRALVYSALKQYDLALADYAQALALNPRDSVAYNNRANVYVKLKRYDLAIPDYSNSIAIDPVDPDGYYNRAKAYTAVKNYEAALQDYGQVILFKPRHTNALYNQAVILELLGRNQEAAQSYRQFIACAKDNDSRLEKARQKMLALGK